MVDFNVNFCQYSLNKRFICSVSIKISEKQKFSYQCLEQIFDIYKCIMLNYCNDNQIDNIKKNICLIWQYYIMKKIVHQWRYLLTIFYCIAIYHVIYREKNEFKSHRYIAFSLGNISLKFNIDIYIYRCIPQRCQSIFRMIKISKQINCTSFNQWIVFVYFLLE